MLGDSNNRQVVNMEKFASSLPRHLLAHIVLGERQFNHSHSTAASNGWLAYIAKGLHLMNCLITLEYHYPRLAAIQRGLEQRACVLDLLMLAGAVWNTELAGASTFSHYVLCAEGIRLTSAALSTALQFDIDNNSNNSNNNTNNANNTNNTNNTNNSNNSNNSNSNNNKNTPNATPNSGINPPHTNGTELNGFFNNNKASIHNNGATTTTTSGGYQFEWYDALVVHPKLSLFIALPVDALDLLQQVTKRAIESSPDHVTKLCRSFHTLLEAFYLMCCSEELVAQMMQHNSFLGGNLLRVLEQSLSLSNLGWRGSKSTNAGNTPQTPFVFQPNEPISSVINQILRVLYLSYLTTYQLYFDANQICTV